MKSFLKGIGKKIKISRKFGETPNTLKLTGEQGTKEIKESNEISPQKRSTSSSLQFLMCSSGGSCGNSMRDFVEVADDNFSKISSRRKKYPLEEKKISDWDQDDLSVFCNSIGIDIGILKRALKVDDDVEVTTFIICGMDSPQFSFQDEFVSFKFAYFLVYLKKLFKSNELINVKFLFFLGAILDGIHIVSSNSTTSVDPDVEKIEEIFLAFTKISEAM